MATDLSERLQAAALSLAGPGPIKDRLFEAYCSYLQGIQEADLPCLGQEFAEMIAALHRERPLPGDHVVRASVRKLSSKEACYYAELVVRLYGTLGSVKHSFARGRGLDGAAKGASSSATSASSLSSAAA